MLSFLRAKICAKLYLNVYSLSFLKTFVFEFTELILIMSYICFRMHIINSSPTKIPPQLVLPLSLYMK